jgi:hypothetical protein
MKQVLMTSVLLALLVSEQVGRLAVSFSGRRPRWWDAPYIGF